MFIYADESGHTGKAIFNEPETYHLGAILSTFDADEVARDVIARAASTRGLERLHGYELLPIDNALIASELISAFDEAGAWQLSVTEIEKPYVATTKFVDMIFDTGENGGVPWLWYNNELFRHQLCIVCDDILTPRNRAAFWTAFLTGDLPALRNCVRNAWTYVHRFVHDARVLEVMKDGFDYFIRYTEEFGVAPAGGRRSYQTHTPNMVAFSCLLRAINAFAESNNSPPLAFVHDRQDEFRKTMREWYELFGPVAIDDDDRGGWPQVRRVAHALPALEIISSKESPALQSVDNLLWVARRRNDPAVEDVRRLLVDRSNEYYISRRMSELIVLMRLRQVARTELRPAELARARSLMIEMEEKRSERLRAGQSA